MLKITQGGGGAEGGGGGGAEGGGGGGAEGGGGGKSGGRRRSGGGGGGGAGGSRCPGRKWAALAGVTLETFPVPVKQKVTGPMDLGMRPMETS